jgi:predicted unusual protein kinase regulating ubiquinone biosynthesis (AarF/ABC1/UbiB family)
MLPFNIMFNKVKTAYFSLCKFLSNWFFIINIFWIVIDELFLYTFLKNYETFINNITRRLAEKNILYVKIFQAFALTNNIIDKRIHNKLLKFTDNVPWTNEDIDKNTLVSLEKEYGIEILNNYKPINSGMISLVFKCIKRNKFTEVNELFIIKMKRYNIENILNEAIDKMLFCLRLLSFIPIINNYQISDVIHNNIDLIKHQTDFHKEVENINKMQNNCKKLRYIKIPRVYADVTNKYGNCIMMEFIEGKPLQDIDPSDYEEYSKQIIKFVLVTLFMNGLCHGDLHTGNMLFIKNDSDPKYKHKIAILDFGILYEIEKMKNILYYAFANMYDLPPEELASNILLSGIIEPVDVISKLPLIHRSNIIAILTQFINDTLYVSNHFSQKNVFRALSFLNDYIVNNNLIVDGFKIRPSDDFIKSQMVFTMFYGVIYTLCGDNYIKLINKVMIELFHIDVSES